MTHHNITGSEVGRRHPPVYLAEIRARPRFGWSLRHVHPAVWLHLAMIPLAIVTGLIDALVIGSPYTSVLAVLALVAWRFWPSRR